MPRRGVRLVAAALAAASALTVAAQQPTFRAGTELVQLDVSVLDKQGEPVHGLTQQDFVVHENGRPQPIVAFKAIDLADDSAAHSPAPVAEWTKTTPRDVATNQLDNHRLFIIVMDDATIIPDPTVIERARDAGRSVIDKMGPSDLATVIFTRRDNRNLQDFTSDHAKLLAMVDAFAVGYRTSSEDPPCSYQLDAIGVLDGVARSLATLPDRRKSLVYISSSLAVDFTRADACGVTSVARDAFRAAQQANVNIYPIDACGLRAFVPPDRRGPSLSVDPCAEPPPYLHVEFLRGIAGNTGGRAIVAINDIEPGVEQMFKASGSYYLIGYAPANANADGTDRKIDVKVPSRRDIDVWTRKNYYAPDAKADAHRAATPQLPGGAKAIAGILPNADVSLQMTSAPFKATGTTSAVAVVLQVARDAANATRADLVDVVVSALAPEGQSVAATSQTTRVAGISLSDGMLRYEILSRLDLPPGRYELRAGVHSGALGKDGSVYGDLDVPDFSKPAVSLSGVILGATPALVSEPRNAIAPLVPIVPTSRRTFDRGDHVTAFVRVYQCGRTSLADVTLHTTIRDAHDALAIDHTETIAAATFDATARSADHRFEIPVASLPAGEYLLTFEAGRGKDSWERDVRFTVK